MLIFETGLDSGVIGGGGGLGPMCSSSRQGLILVSSFRHPDAVHLLANSGKNDKEQ